MRLLIGWISTHDRTGPSKEMASVWFTIKSNLGEKEVNLSSQSQAIVRHYVEIKAET